MTNPIHGIPNYKTKAKFYMMLFFFELSKIIDWDMQENDSQYKILELWGIIS